MISLTWQNFQPIAVIAATPTAVKLLTSFCQVADITIWVSSTCYNALKLTDDDRRWGEKIRVYQQPLREHIGSLWSSHQALIFCFATGAVVRLIAPLLTNKAEDPAILVLDEGGQFVISLCGGHQGGADQLTRLLAQQLQRTPILTGTASLGEWQALDLLGVPFGWQRGEGDWTELSGVPGQGGAISLVQEAGFSTWQQHQPDGLFTPPSPPLVKEGTLETSPLARGEESTETEAESGKPVRGKILITPRVVMPSEMPTVSWHPRVLWIGIGCERDTPQVVMIAAIKQILAQFQLSLKSVAGIATIDIKQNETGLIELCQQYQWPLQTYPATRLQTLEVPNPSPVVAEVVGTASVAEAAAICAAQEWNAITDDWLKMPANSSLIVPKQVFRLPDHPGAVTVAVAQAEREYIGKSGRLYLVGIGPGNLDQITPSAQVAITEADMVIGYSLYLDLIRPLFRPGQLIEASPITQERQRGERAIQFANWGLTVAVVSSGDCGIYGMAGLVLEQLSEQGWDGNTPQVKVFPGISALQAAASKLGAPLMHDFCAISLSDLLTPWEVITKRLEAAAMADFVVALYNPKSQKRTQQILTAQKIFLKYRDPQTPVGIVRSVYRDNENVILTTLEKFTEFEIDMLSLIMIGNQTTQNYQHWMITPRGYFQTKE